MSSKWGALGAIVGRALITAAVWSFIYWRGYVIDIFVFVVIAEAYWVIHGRVAATHTYVRSMHNRR